MPGPMAQANLFLIFYARLKGMESTDPLQTFWDNLLSRNPQQIRAAFSTLDAPSKRAVINHLRKMTTETGWHPEQVKSAQMALNILERNQKDEK